MKTETSPRGRAWKNPVRETLRKGQPVVGVSISVNNVEIAAQAAALGFDFLWLEMEHAPVTLETVRNVVLATRGLKAVPFARPPVNQLWTAKRLLDAGVLGVVFPFTSSPEQARQAVAACRYPSAGLRGSGASLAQFRWPAPGGYYDFADANVMVVAIIEDVPGLASVDEITATPGIDVIFIGTSDLSFALGLRGEQEHPRLKQAIAKIVAAGKRNRKILGRPAGSLQQIRRYQKEGFLFFQTRTELEFMARGAEQLLKPLGKQRQIAAGGAV